jgi:hypothetical protein
MLAHPLGLGSLGRLAPPNRAHLDGARHAPPFHPPSQHAHPSNAVNEALLGGGAVAFHGHDYGYYVWGSPPGELIVHFGTTTLVGNKLDKRCEHID